LTPGQERQEEADLDQVADVDEDEKDAEKLHGDILTGFCPTDGDGRDRVLP